MFSKRMLFVLTTAAALCVAADLMGKLTMCRTCGG
jgi:hypothetical protein